MLGDGRVPRARLGVLLPPAEREASLTPSSGQPLRQILMQAF
jgi:hypothetical protein